MLVYIFMRTREDLYAFTPCEDGANLPNGREHGRWELQGTINLHTGKPTDPVALSFKEVDHAAL